jgi:hypothetical protein
VNTDKKVDPKLLKKLQTMILKQQAELTEMRNSGDPLKVIVSYEATRFMKEFVSKLIELPNVSRQLVIRYINETNDMCDYIMTETMEKKDANESV